MFYYLFHPLIFVPLHYIRVTPISKMMQTIVIWTVAKSLPKNKIILLMLLISKSYIPYTDLRKDIGKSARNKK